MTTFKEYYVLQEGAKETLLKWAAAGLVSAAAYGMFNLGRSVHDVIVNLGDPEEYSKEEVPVLCHDEVRIPIIAQSLGYQLRDTGFFREWFSKKEFQFFNCNGTYISPEVIQRESSKPNGRRVFHPVREIVRKVSNNLL